MTGERAMIHIDNNLGPLGPAQGFHLDVENLTGFEWTGESFLTAAQVLTEGKTDVVDEAIDWLETYLLDGVWRWNNDVNEARKLAKAKISGRAYEAAKKILDEEGRLENVPASPGGPWHMRLLVTELPSDQEEPADKEIPKIHTSVCPSCLMGDGRHGARCSNRKKEE